MQMSFCTLGYKFSGSIMPRLKKTKTCLISSNLAGSEDDVFWKSRSADSGMSLTMTKTLPPNEQEEFE